MSTIPEALSIAAAKQQAGQLEEAEQIVGKFCRLIRQAPERGIVWGELRASAGSGRQPLPVPRFARNVESAYRSIWQRWCRQDSR